MGAYFVVASARFVLFRFVAHLMLFPISSIIILAEDGVIGR